MKEGDTIMSQSLKNLKHVRRTLPNGGKILVLDTGAVIGAESEAMLQALHSRSIGGIEEHLKVLEEKGSEKFMSTFYVGYGHRSIGDCGTGTIFIEGVSMLAAKAIQDWKLYSGQEASTRYIDFSSQPFLNPLNTYLSSLIHETLRTFYLHGLDVLQPSLKERFPRQENEKESVYEKAIKARAFDIMRSFLPAGATTNLAWHSNLRQMADKLIMLRHHPLEEVRLIALAMEEAVTEMYPNSFSNKRHDTTEQYNHLWMNQNNYFSSSDVSDFRLRNDTIDRLLLKENREVLEQRPPKTELPKYLDEVGTLQFEFLLDFGSFRDIQRHRPVTQRMPLVTTRHGFGQWYLEEMPTELKNEAESVLAELEQQMPLLKTTPELAQYYIPMGYNLPNRITGTLPELVYLVELRATRFVHPTLRRHALQMAQIMQNMFTGHGLAIHLDPDPDRFDVKRGEHDIVVK